MRIAMLSYHTCPLATLGGKNTGGMNVYVQMLTRRLGRLGVHVDVFTRSQDEHVPHVLHDLGYGNRVVHVLAGPEIPLPKQELAEHIPTFVDGILEFAAKKGCTYDLIHSHYWMSGMAALELKTIWGAPVIHMYHTLGLMKQRVAQNAEEADRIAFLPHDAYYRDLSELPVSKRVEINFDHPDSLESELLVDHVKQLRAGKPIDMPVYNFKTHSRTSQTITVQPQPVILVEGILIFNERNLCDLFDVKIFVDTDPDIRFIRRLQRDIAERGRTTASVIEQYLQTVRPMHMEFVEPSKRYADVIIPEGGFNTVALDMVVARVEELLAQER